MKSFLSLKEFIEYCFYCPVCRANTREISITVGPDAGYLIDKSVHSNLIKLENYQYDDEHLILDASAKIFNEKHTFIFTIDVNNNTFIFTAPVIDGRSMQPKMYFYIFGICKSKLCESSVNSIDINLNTDTKKISACEIETELRHIRDGGKYYSLEYLYDSNTISIMKSKMIDDAEKYNSSDEGIIIPMTEFDFSNKEALLARLKTIVLFS